MTLNLRAFGSAKHAVNDFLKKSSKKEVVILSTSRRKKDTGAIFFSENNVLENRNLSNVKSLQATQLIVILEFLFIVL